ncbi:MAG: putative ABC transporter ATP-binding protein [Acidimicrobiia bacterium]|nr:MAG: putative ABC transporter ATP-binding protein [Acidimicrobiia bacterium]
MSTVSRAAAIRVEDLWFAYPDGTEVLRGVALALEPGERVALLGPNGAGKTTLVLHLNGILTPSRGRVVVGETTVDDAHLREVRRRVGLVFQDADDQLFMPTVWRDVAFGPANFGVEGEELEHRVAAALQAVGAAHLAQRPPHHLSGGEKRRVAIATVLAMEPEVIVLDEPTSSLDPAGRRELADVLSRLTQTVLLVTHDLPFALELCPRSLILNHGRVVADGATWELLADAELMAANRLELPFGLDPTRARPPA